VEGAVAEIVVDDHWFGAPWTTPDVVVLLHGIAESAEAWRMWVPHLAGRLRVIRPDLPGFGRSPRPSPGFDWSPSAYAGAVVGLLDRLGLAAIHLVGAKYGGTIAMQLAADHPSRVRTLSVVSAPVAAAGTGARVDLGTFADRIRRDGVRAWAAATQRTRLGPEASDAQVAWWTDALMGRAHPDACIGATMAAGALDIRAVLPRIQARTLVLTTEGSALQSVDAARAWVATIPRARLHVMPGSAYHLAAVQPEACARLVLEHIEKES
jgi:pimeloyl-ACP methyl ester carboxylesterase